MMTPKLMSVAANNDAELVVGTLAGNRDAFSQIVSRYQSLISSLTYCATGNLGQSEDLAQETFITAWKHLVHLRERDKLRSWLCGIARNRINNFLRREGREPLHKAGELDEISEIHSPEPLPVDYTINNEEQAILWRSLERIPEIYREPLVLFYREHQSIEAVAEKLELTEDNVKQRLSRGRKMLHEQVLEFVEGALERTNPGKVFTLGVIAALPAVATSAKAATVGAALAKGGAAAKGVATVGTLGGLFAMLGGAYVTWRAQADDTKSPRERQFVLQMIGVRVVVVSLVFAVSFGILKFGFSHQPVAREFLKAAYIFSIYVLGMGLLAYTSRRRQQIQIEEKTFAEAEWTTPRKNTDHVANPHDTKLNFNLKAVKFKAFVLVLAAILIFQLPWKQHLSEAILWSAGFVLALFWSFQIWRNLPRYLSMRLGWIMVCPVLTGLTTLLSFNFHQYQAQAGSDASAIASPTEVLTFNLAVVLAYVVFVGIIVWMRKAEVRSMPQN